jgi:hypothetical protein
LSFKMLSPASGAGHVREERALLIQHDRSLPPQADWVDAIRALFQPMGGLDLPAIERAPREPPDFSGPGWDTEIKA